MPLDSYELHLASSLPHTVGTIPGRGEDGSSHVPLSPPHLVPQAQPLLYSWPSNILLALNPLLPHPPLDLPLFPLPAQPLEHFVVPSVVLRTPDYLLSASLLPGGTLPWPHCLIV